MRRAVFLILCLGLFGVGFAVYSTIFLTGGHAPDVGAVEPERPSQTPTPSVEVPPDHAPVQVTVSAAASMARFLRPGDTVAVFLSRPAANGEVEVLFLSNARLGQDAGYLASANDRSGTYQEVVSEEITLIVPTAQAGRVAAAQMAGVLTISLMEASDDIDAVSDIDHDALLGLVEMKPPASTETSECFMRVRRGDEIQQIAIPCDDAGPAADQNPDLAGVMGQLKSADLAFNKPEEMRIGQSTVVELILAPDTISPLDTLPAETATPERAEALGLPEGRVGTPRVVENVDYSMRMQAELSGHDFVISPDGLQAKTVLPNKTVNWVWTVEPKTHGPDRILTLSVSALVRQGDRDLPPIPIETFTERIHVHISGWDRVVVMAKDVSSVHAAIAGVGASIFGVVAWLWARRQKPETPEKEPLEIVVTHKMDDGDA